MVRLRPIDVDVPGSHRLEGAFHSKRAHIDVNKHSSDVQHAYHAVHNLCCLHRGNLSPVKWKQQNIAGHDSGPSADDNDPKYQLFSRIEFVCWRFFASQHAATALEPLNIRACRQVAGDPHQEHQHDAAHETGTD